MTLAMLSVALMLLISCDLDLEETGTDETAVERIGADEVGGWAVTPIESEPATSNGDPILSLLNEPLPPVALPNQVRADFEAKLARASADYEADPENADAMIWLGRRLAYLGRYQEAIKVYSKGIELHPEEARFYRHRGHRYITTRQFDKAIADFETATGLIEGTEDRVEPDGLPNERGIPTSTLQSNIWYHLGLARYLERDFAGAVDAYEKCLEVSRNPDMLVATTHWLYMTLRRLGRDAEAAEILEPITIDLDVIENHDYHRLLLLYRGDLRQDQVASAESDGPGSAAAIYGIGNWHLYEGRPEKGKEIFLDLLETDQWAAFGYIAAEAEIAYGLREGDT